jgi:hypothetical protein
MRLKWVLLLGVVAAATSVLPASGSARPSDEAFAPRSGAIGGIVPTLDGFQGQALGSGDLSYHDGPVMRTNTTYAIYWAPPGFSLPAGYQSTIDQFFTDVAADSGLTTNVYAIDNQYFDASGNITYSSTFGGSVLDTHPYPANGCADFGLSTCLSDAQLRAEIASVIDAEGWPEDGKTQYFLFTPEGVGSCFTSFGGDCAYTTYCAYHGSFVDGGGEIVYANQPWTETTGTDYHCDRGQYPNGSSSGADPTINVTSHEHNEAITDEDLDAWYDDAGYENGDKCAWTFGTLSGPGGGRYSQTINGHHYYLQEEYDNATHGCLQMPGGTQVPITGPLKPSALGQGASNAKVAITGANFVSGATVSVSGTGVNVSSVTFVGPGTLLAKLTVAAGAAAGTRDVTVTNPGPASGTCTGCLTIDVGPTVTQVVPPAGARGGTSLPVQILGSNFVKGASVKFGKGIKVNSHAFVNANEIDAVITISPTAKTGGYTVTVTNKDKGVGTLANGFTVT